MSKQIIALLVMLGLNVSALAQTQDGVMLQYMVSEPGLEPYPSRIIVTDAMVRMDDGVPGGDFLLFDRKSQLISSVTHEDGMILEIPAREVTQQSPILLKRDQSLEADSTAPMIDDKQPHRLRLLVNDKLCYDAVVVPGLLPDTLKALRDFNRVLAGEQGKMLGALPGEMLEACDLAIHTFYSEWALESGLAIQEYDVATRRGRLLVDIDQAFKVEPRLFELPSNYRHYSTP
jgi:hypothetical protein